MCSSDCAAVKSYSIGKELTYYCRCVINRNMIVSSIVYAALSVRWNGNGGKNCSSHYKYHVNSASFMTTGMLKS